MNLLLVPGLVALLAEPTAWLVHTWREPAYDSQGWLVALLAAGLAVRSVASGPAAPDARAVRAGLGLLGLTAAVRLAGRLLDVSHVGATALVADALAAGLLLGLGRRPWPVAPWALAGLVALSLPVEHTLQQLVSYPLRLASAATVALLLGVERDGTLLAGDLSVDLPCSGATGLVTLGVLAFAVAARRRAGPRGLALGTLAVTGGAWLANTVRLALLVVRPSDAWLADPHHTALGLTALGIGALPALALARSLPVRSPSAGPPAALPTLPAPLALAFSGLALVVAAAPSHPLDVSGPTVGPGLPGALGGLPSVARELSAQEREYFGRFGGTVERRTYATDPATTVLLVRTTAPLRHLHSPDACLRGAGHDVERMGVRDGTVVWRTVDPDGRAWRVEASFTSSEGDMALSASEVAWRWLRSPGATWTLLERVTPWEACDADPAACAAFERDLFHALETPELACSRC